MIAAAMLSCLGASRLETSGQTAASHKGVQRASARSNDTARLGRLLQTSASCSLRSGAITGMMLGTADTGESLVLPSGCLSQAVLLIFLLHEAAAAAAAITMHEGS